MDADGTTHRLFETPVGTFVLFRRPGGALSADWDDGSGFGSSTHDPDLLPDLADRLERYFGGQIVDFDDVPTPKGPAFHRDCWASCRTIAWGETRSYGELATMAGSGKAAQAAGQAMRTNPLPVIVPCHRVVAAGGKLHGYSGSVDPAGRELAIKDWLLGLERSGPQ